MLALLAIEHKRRAVVKQTVEKLLEWLDESDFDYLRIEICVGGTTIMGNLYNSWEKNGTLYLDLGARGRQQTIKTRNIKRVIVQDHSIYIGFREGFITIWNLF